MKYFEEKNYKLTNQEKRTLAMINENPENFISMSIAKFSVTYNLNISNISRTSKKLHMDNVNQLKMTLKEKMVFVENHKKSNETNALSNMHEHYKNTIKFNVNKNVSKKVVELSKDITNFNNVYIYGHGSSFFAAKNLEIQMSRLGVNSMLNFGDWYITETMENIKKDDLIIYFTERGDTPTVEKIRQVVSNQKAKIWIITHNIKVKEGKFEKVIYYDFIDDSNKTKTPCSKIAQLLISDCIIDNL